MPLNYQKRDEVESYYRQMFDKVLPHQYLFSEQIRNDLLQLHSDLCDVFAKCLPCDWVNAIEDPGEKKREISDIDKERTSSIKQLKETIKRLDDNKFIERLQKTLDISKLH